MQDTVKIVIFPSFLYLMGVSVWRVKPVVLKQGRRGTTDHRVKENNTKLLAVPES